MADNPTASETSGSSPGRVFGRRTARFALLMSFAAVMLAGYLSYTLIYLQPIAAQAYKTQQSIDALEQRVLAEMDTALMENQRTFADLGQAPSGRKPKGAAYIGKRRGAEFGGANSK